MALADMQQRNVTAAEAASADALDPLTGEFLQPTDNKKQCADNDAAGFSPVNPALTQLKRLITGLRGSLRGDFTGAVQRSLKSLFINTTGGTPHAQTPGTLRVAGTGTSTDNAILVNVGNIVTLIGDIGVGIGSIFVSDNFGVMRVGSGPQSEQRASKFAFTAVGTTAVGSNPPQGTAMANELRAINIPKVHCTIRMSAPGVLDFSHGCGVANVTISAGQFLVTFAAPFADVNYTLQPGPHIHSGATNYWVMDTITSRTTTTCLIGVQSLGGGFLDPAAVAMDGVQFSILGKQST